MPVTQTTACSHGEISGVSFETPTQTIEGVCKDALTTGHYGDAPNGKLYNFYIFSAAITVGGKRYGDNLANFIKDNGLGDILETPAMENVKFHPQRSNKVYVWIVDQKAVQKWYTKLLKGRAVSNGFVMEIEDFSDELNMDLNYGDDLHVARAEF